MVGLAKLPWVKGSTIIVLWTGNWCWSCLIFLCFGYGKADKAHHLHSQQAEVSRRRLASLQLLLLKPDKGGRSSRAERTGNNSHSTSDNSNITEYQVANKFKWGAHGQPQFFSLLPPAQPPGNLLLRSHPSRPHSQAPFSLWAHLCGPSTAKLSPLNTCCLMDSRFILQT